MRTASVLGLIAAVLTLVNLTALLAAATGGPMGPHVRLMVLGGHLAGVILFTTLTALLLRRASGAGVRASPLSRASSAARAGPG